MAPPVLSPSRLRPAREQHGGSGIYADDKSGLDEWLEEWAAAATIKGETRLVAGLAFIWGQVHEECQQKSGRKGTASGHAFARYVLAAIFPVISLPMYQNLQVRWTTLVRPRLPGHRHGPGPLPAGVPAGGQPAPRHREQHWNDDNDEYE